jgi:hypothetical protein
VRCLRQERENEYAGALLSGSLSLEFPNIVSR